MNAIIPSGYAELQVSSNFSFLRGAAHPHELVGQAKALGTAAIALTDRNSLAGVVRAHVAAKEAGIDFIPGCRLDLEDAPSLLCYPTDRAAYGRLCALLTLGQRRAAKGACQLRLADVAAHSAGQCFILLPDTAVPEDDATSRARHIRKALDAPCWLGAQTLFHGDDRARLAALDACARKAGLALVALNDVHYHIPARRALQDVVACIREGCTIAEAGYRLFPHAERHIKTPNEMARLFADHPDALAATLEIAGLCRFSLDELRYEYPTEPVPAGRSAQDHLAALSWAGAAQRYPQGIPAKVQDLIHRELALIGTLGYAPYFLTVHDIVQWAQGQGILCQGRGSAANSAVCYALGVTAVDPAEIDLLFERFINAERREPPDIDVDFEHERREEVIQYVYARYGRDRAGLAATVIHYRWRRAIREVGKAMGLSADMTAALAGTAWGGQDHAIDDARVREAGLDPADPYLRLCLNLARDLVGFPRHLSQHVGGFVLTRGPLCELVPIGNAAMAERTFIEWDKDDIDALGILKVDILALGMLTAIRKGFELIARHHGRHYDLASVPREVPEVYDMLCRADAIGVFQVESRAQLSMLPRLKPRCFYDLVVEVAIVRPGPIQGDMVHPYLRRRNGMEPASFPQPAPEHGPADELHHVLGRTYGVPLFQEQAMRLAIVAAGFSAVEADQLRRAMATFRRLGTIDTLRGKFIAGMTRRGYDADFAARCFQMIEGFGDYGFPESHAASFAHLVYVSAWLKWAYPDVFACALLNAQPMGFYAPAQIIRDARDHGVEVRAADVNDSGWDNDLEPLAGGRHAVRLGLRQVVGLARADAEKLIAARGNGYPALADLRRRSGIGVGAVETLAAADTCRSLGFDRRQALWEARALGKQAPLPLFAHAETTEQGDEPAIALPTMPLAAHVIADYQTLRLSLKAHPLTFLRQDLAHRGVIPAIDLIAAQDREWLKIAGIVLVRQRPGTAAGVVFMTIEDETGIANIIVWPKRLEQQRAIVMGAKLVEVHGQLQRADGVTHVIAHHLIDRSGDLYQLTGTGASQPAPSPATPRHPRNVRVIPNSRDFH